MRTETPTPHKKLNAYDQGEFEVIEWHQVYNKELFMPYDDFPWFKDQAVKAIFNVEEQARDHFYWPDPDVDLTVEMESWVNKTVNTSLRQF